MAGRTVPCTTDTDYRAAQVTATTVAKRLQGRRALQLVNEGSEPGSFWAFLGGRGEYPSEKTDFDSAREPQLFHCSNARGFFDVEPIYDYSQVRCRPCMPQPVHV